MADYPPLTPLAEYPLHGWDYGDAREYACKRPEDPDCGQYDWRCPSCLLAALASIQTYGDHEITWRQDANTPERQVMLSWLVGRSIFWLYEAADG